MFFCYSNNSAFSCCPPFRLPLLPTRQMTQVVLVDGTDCSNLNINAGCRVGEVTVTNLMWEVFTESCDEPCVVCRFWSQVAGDLERLGRTISLRCISHQFNILTLGLPKVSCDQSVLSGIVRVSA